MAMMIRSLSDLKSGNLMPNSSTQFNEIMLEWLRPPIRFQWVSFATNTDARRVKSLPTIIRLKLQGYMPKYIFGRKGFVLSVGEDYEICSIACWQIVTIRESMTEPMMENNAVVTNAGPGSHDRDDKEQYRWGNGEIIG
ncbi:hypothetical protein KIN20_032443 [Parelaphostrongylus tenuis]|uniref:Uncharacterized protein n=1 Tax=Parelaphostrongylus tenuis TaxID=148309 RepID=A0AAD5R761_PARTN|nr:hypothetical protein KIN20_032443 [Parelaphostrongylus tenuis]